MASLNLVQLMGNLTRQPELKTLHTGSTVVEFGLATNRRWKDAEGVLQEDVCFVEVSFFGKRAETIHRWLNKGDPIYVQGRLRFSRWETAEGEPRNKLRVVGERFEFLPRPGGGGQKRELETEQPARAPVSANEVPF